MFFYEKNNDVIGCSSLPALPLVFLLACPSGHLLLSLLIFFCLISVHLFAVLRIRIYYYADPDPDPDPRGKDKRRKIKPKKIQLNLSICVMTLKNHEKLIN